MNESLSRWEGRIGSLKGFAVLVLIFLVIFLFPVAENLNIALKNPADSRAVTVSQLISGQIGEGLYVNVSGLASYELCYTETEDGVRKAIIYPLIDQDAGTVVFVRTTRIELETAPDAMVTVSGMTDDSPTELKNIIEQDIPDINAAGFQTSSVLYIEEGKMPGKAGTYLLELGAMGIAGLLCIVTFFFPSTVFNPFPLQPVTPGAEASKAVRATGNFQQVKKMEPLEWGRSRRKFQNSNANLFVMDDRTLGVYIHFIYAHRVYGVQVSKQETDWMILVKPMQVIAIEPGKIYGWRDQWAVSIRFRDANEKEQTVFLGFENAASQVSFVNFLREKGYAVSSGQYTVTGSAWS